MDLEKLDVDKETTKLANDIRDALGTHILKLNEKCTYQETLTSCLTALAIEVAQIRWLSIETDQVEPDKFDELFWNGVLTHFNVKKRQYGTSN